MKLFLKLVIFILLFNNVILSDEPRTTDIPGSKDNSFIPRYKNAVIQYYKLNEYAEYVLGIADPIQKKLRGHGRYFAKYIDLEGKQTRIQYLIPKEEGLFKVYKIYEKYFKKNKFEILYKTSKKDCNDSTFWNEDLYGGGNGINDLTGDSYGVSGRDGFYFIATHKKLDSKDVYIVLFINNGSNYGKKFVLLTEDIIEVENDDSGLSLENNTEIIEPIKTNEINKNILLSGHITLKGIYFDKARSTIKESSKEAIKNISEYLNKNKDKKFLIVGHTDSDGDFNKNIELSYSRAKAVINELVSKYNVNKEQLKPYGIACVSPVATNSTEKGKAKNRRVEIVEMLNGFSDISLEKTVDTKTKSIIDKYKKIYPEYIKLSQDNRIYKSKLKSLNYSNMSLKRELAKLKMKIK